jgi:hypothetical protein
MSELMIRFKRSLDLFDSPFILTAAPLEPLRRQRLSLMHSRRLPVPMPISPHTLLIPFIMIFAAVPTFAHANCARIQALAQEQSNNMARRDRMDHDGFESRRARGALAENVATGCKTKACAMQQWRNSPGHNANMNLPYPCKMVASATSRGGTTYWTMEIGEDEATAKLRKAKAAKSLAARPRSWISSF